MDSLVTVNHRRRLPLAFVLFAALLAGCAGKQTAPEAPAPARIELVTIAAADINPDIEGRPSPLLLRVYALRGRDGFSGADFFSLFEKDEQVLAADLAKREEFILQPGQTQRLSREYAPDVTHIAVMAAFRDVERSTWRALVAVPPGIDGALILNAGASAVTLSIESAGKAENEDEDD